MKPKIIALTGSSSVGKSSTIRLAYNRIMVHPEVKYSEFTAINKRDFFAIIEISKLMIWFISQGDAAGMIKDHLNSLRRYRHDVIVCSTRSKGGTKKLIESYNPTHEIKWKKLKKLDPSRRQKVNEQDAQWVFDQIPISN